jgi:hypothetical protein
MTLSRPARRTLGASGAFLLGGMLGVVWWAWRNRPGRNPVTRLRRVRGVLAAVGLIVVAVGVVWRADTAVRPAPDCFPSGSSLPAASHGSLDVSLLAEKVATWSVTGLGLLYAQADDAPVCWSPREDYYLAVHSANPAGARWMSLGDIVLTPGFDLPRESLLELIGHEARHRTQWAVAIAVAGPLAFPVAYAVDDFFFPGPRNHFERLAGLEAGGYEHEGTGPVLGPAQVAVLAAVAAIIVFSLVAMLRRRAWARSRVRH